MTSPPPVSSWAWLWRYVVAALILAFLGMRYFGQDRPLMVIDLVLLAFHESSHWAAIWLPRTPYMLAGSVGQVAIPLAIGLYLHRVQRDRLGVPLGLGWAGVSCAGVARYIADAPTESLPLVGGTVHDWGYLLGADGFGGLQNAAAIADAVRMAGVAAIVLAVAWCVLVPVLTATGRLAPPERPAAWPRPRVHGGGLPVSPHRPPPPGERYGDTPPA